MNVTVNGQIQQLVEGTALLSYIAECGLNPDVLVIEYNGNIVHRDQWSAIKLADGDKVEILTFVGGG